MSNLLESLINISRHQSIHQLDIQDFFSEPFLHLYCKDYQGKYLVGNDALAKSVGLKDGSALLGLVDHDLCTRKDAAILHANDERVMQKKTPITYRESINTISGNHLACISYKFPLFSSLKKIIGIFGCTIITGKGYDYSCTFIEGRRITKREKEVLYYLTRGKTAKEIALMLGLSYRTIEHYIEKIKIKTKVSSKSELIEKAIHLFM